MSRQSVMPSSSTTARQSIYPGGPASSSSGGAPSQSQASPAARLAAKQAELEGLKQLRDYSALLVKELEKMGEGLDQIRKGGESAAQVMASWQTVFRGIQVAQASVADRTRPTEGADPDEEEERLASLVPDTLVRIPVDQSYAQGNQQESGAGAGAGADDA